jgi:hypothetical protein
MGTNSKDCFLDGIRGKSLVVFQNKVVFFKFFKELFFGGVGWDGWKKGVGIFLFIFLFF